MTKKLIVNADDYGHTAGVSAGIRQAHLNGIVTSTSAMMNRPAVIDAIQIATRECPQLGIGVHLILTTGGPVSEPQKVLSLIRADGLFYRPEQFSEAINHFRLEEVWKEWHAQVERFVKVAGRNPDHLDSHHHSSYFTPQLFDLMVRLANEIGCPIRRPFGEGSADAADYLPPELLDENGKGYSYSSELLLPKTTDGFIGDFYDEGAATENLIQIIERIAADPVKETFELMCHPAMVDDTLMVASSYNTQRGRELEILISDEVKAALVDHGIKLINFSELVQTVLTE